MGIPGGDSGVAAGAASAAASEHAKRVHCDCGFDAEGGDDVELVAAAQRHARDAHAMDLPARLILLMARPDAEGTE